LQRLRRLNLQAYEADASMPWTSVFTQTHSVSNVRFQYSYNMYNVCALDTTLRHLAFGGGV